MTVILAALNWFVTSPIGRALGLIAAALAGVAIIFFKGKSAGREAERRKASERTLREVKRYRNVQERNRRLSDGELRDRLRKWSSR
ncbi:hypothetical protein HW532_15780 [Kaustia mangrovi]|uniref:Uncharacterized protein n=1 Tax=Kaustia mangrovi TaxID=2593653 RepID=A0A7S8HCS0_9HYPH|nr:hypothetical protein [Kaustia mangrovi]QPC44022.1 hypothetical protein HW532_15780 [Kaustia mangrovi]